MTTDAAETEPRFAQALQYFFIHKILTVRHTRGTWLRRDDLHAFFDAWSRIVTRGEKENVAKTVPNIAAVLARLERAAPQGKAGAEETREAATVRDTDGPDLSDVPEPYHKLVKSPSYAPFLELLADEDLGELMRIPYPAERERTALAAALPAAPAGGAILEAIARTLSKRPEEIKPQDYKNVTGLDLSNAEIDNLEPLRALNNLQTLYLRGTQVQDLEPLKTLNNLQTLDLEGTQVQDLETLKALNQLQWLDLTRTQVQDLEPLKALNQLQWLDLTRTQVQDLEPLKGLTNLQVLFLTRTLVQDLEPLKALTDLQVLGLSATQVQDLEPLKALNNLQTLYLTATQVQDLEPLKTLNQLQWLDLTGTQIQDLEPLKGLTNLQRLDLIRTQVTTSQVKALKAARPNLIVRR